MFCHSTKPTPSFPFVKEGIFFVIGVPLWAKRLGALLSTAYDSGITSTHVFDVCNRLKVIRVYTTANPAFMIKLRTGIAFEESIRNAVSQTRIIAPSINQPIPVLVYPPKPQPATAVRLWN